jgi:hypothetical protein
LGGDSIVQQPITERSLSREQAVAIADLIEERMETEYARFLAARKPDARITSYRNASDLRRSARRLREGLFRPAWMTDGPEELAREYEYAAEYDDLEVRVHRLTSAHKRVQQHLADNLFAEVGEVFDRLKGKLRDADLDPITVENILELRPPRRRGVGRPKG